MNLCIRESNMRMSPYLDPHLNIFCLLQEAQADRLQSLSRPFMEPVYHCTIHNGWELPTANSQLISHRGKTKSNLRNRRTCHQKRVTRKARQIKSGRNMILPCWKLTNTTLQQCTIVGMIPSSLAI